MTESIHPDPETLAAYVDKALAPAESNHHVVAMVRMKQVVLALHQSGFSSPYQIFGMGTYCFDYVSQFMLEFEVKKDKP